MAACPPGRDHSGSGNVGARKTEPRAAELAGDRPRARAHYAALVALGQHADTERPELRHARAFLAR